MAVVFILWAISSLQDPPPQLLHPVWTFLPQCTYGGQRTVWLVDRHLPPCLRQRSILFADTCHSPADPTWSLWRLSCLHLSTPLVVGMLGLQTSSVCPALHDSDHGVRVTNTLSTEQCPQSHFSFLSLLICHLWNEQLTISCYNLTTKCVMVAHECVHLNLASACRIRFQNVLLSLSW